MKKNRKYDLWDIDNESWKAVDEELSVIIDLVGKVIFYSGKASSEKYYQERYPKKLNINSDNYYSNLKEIVSQKFRNRKFHCLKKIYVETKISRPSSNIDRFFVTSENGRYEILITKND